MNATNRSTTTASQPANELSESELATLKQNLLEQRRWLIDSDAAHRHENQAAAADAEVEAELQEHVAEELVLVDAALARIHDGQYGVCFDCHQPIGFARLRAYPVARRCIDCKRKFEVARS